MELSDVTRKKRVLTVVTTVLLSESMKKFVDAKDINLSLLVRKALCELGYEGD